MRLSGDDGPQDPTTRFEGARACTVETFHWSQHHSPENVHLVDVAVCALPRRDSLLPSMPESRGGSLVHLSSSMAASAMKSFPDLSVPTTSCR